MAQPDRLNVRGLDPQGQPAGFTIVVGVDGEFEVAALDGVIAATTGREVAMAPGVSYPAEPLEAPGGGDWLYVIPGSV